MLCSVAIFTFFSFAATVSSAPQPQTTSPSAIPICSQPRSSSIPSAADLIGLVKPQIPLVCQSLEGSSGRIASDVIEGYLFYGGPTTGSAPECEQAFANILSQCVEQQNFYGGEVVLSDRQLYTLINARGSLNPILSGSGAVQASSSIIITTPAVPQLSDLTVASFPTGSQSGGQSVDTAATGTVQDSTSQVGQPSQSLSTVGSSSISATIASSSSLTQSYNSTQASGASLHSQTSFYPLIPTSTTAGYTLSSSIQSSVSNSAGISPPLLSPSFPSTTASSTTTSSAILGNGEIGQTRVTSTPILNCQQNIPTDGPTPSDVANALTTANGIATICAGNFDGSGDSTHMTFNHGFIDIELIRSSATQTLTHCNDAINSIISTCILSSADYGGIYSQDGETYNITNTIAPANPLIPGTDEGAPSTTSALPTTSSVSPPPTASTTTASSGPPTPSQIRSNNHGSALCQSLAGSCKIAYTGYNDTWLYTQYTSYAANPGDTDATDLLFDPLADDGCAAMFTCDNNDAYSVGMLGSQIKAA